MDFCLFCKIVRKEIPANIVLETENLLVFPDINPAADVHILIVPKAHIANISEAKDNGNLLSEIYKAADKLVEDNNLREGMYRILVNGGKAQHVPHLHFHFLGGNWTKKDF